MADITVTVEKVGLEDINVGTGTYSRTTSTGGSQTMNKVNASNIPLLTTNAYWPASKYVENILDMLFKTYQHTLQRAKFGWTDANTITIGPGAYFHWGTVDQVVYWDETLSFDSTDSGSRWYYLYIDDSAVVSLGTNLLSAAGFTNSTTAPTWSDAKHGWYNGDDRCIFAYYVDDGSITLFTHDGGDYVQCSPGFVDRSSTDITGSAEEALTIPGFSTRAKVYVGIDADNSVIDGNLLFSEGTVVLEIVPSHYTATSGDYITDSSQSMTLTCTSYTGQILVELYTQGWYFPTGM